ncbi:unnamed protein product [Rhizophagus irregularis]|nr:unnamed protein product [Rhizophagus irregularis]CAB5369549.1 unnamed protein product [Rhizophagus irregularis]
MPTRLSLDLHGRQGETKVQGRRPTWYHDKHVKIEMIRLSPTQTPLVAATVWILNSYVLVYGEDQLVRKSFIRVASENKSIYHDYHHEFSLRCTVHDESNYL